ncbi:MAG: hypothetical protein MJ252_05920 [archaeon]|nr:hypothetical protein [archaeon]
MVQNPESDKPITAKRKEVDLTASTDNTPAVGAEGLRGGRGNNFNESPMEVEYGNKEERTQDYFNKPPNEGNQNDDRKYEERFNSNNYRSGSNYGTVRII